MIPEKAIEVAAEVMYDAFGWDEGTLEKVARAILEAAAPFIQAAAWEQGAQAQASAYGMTKDTGPNPYRAPDVV